MKKDPRKVISENLSSWMDASVDLDTLEKVSEKSGVSYGTVRRIKNAEVNATITNLNDIANAFGRSVSELASENSSNKPHEIADLARTVESLNSSGKISAAEIKAMIEMLKARS